jgi:tRNA/tmRNA/rRNA uracil-C5-methylase (TrmA/RlmC/RlmD family)
VRGKNFQFPVAHFFQSNIIVLEKLVERFVEPLKGVLALDLYSGAGLFSLFLADNFDSIECVESDAASMEAARLNLSRARAKVGFSDILVERWIQTPHANRAFDCIVADPPRAGLSPELRAWLAGAQADALLYVSCDHASLARDLRDLTQKGWRTEDITLFDFYPQTGRLEAVARLARAAR